MVNQFSLGSMLIGIACVSFLIAFVVTKGNAAAALIFLGIASPMLVLAYIWLSWAKQKLFGNVKEQEFEAAFLPVDQGSKREAKRNSID